MQPRQDAKFLPLTAFARAAAIASTSLAVPFTAYAHSPVATARPAPELTASAIAFQPSANQLATASTLTNPNLLIARADDGSWQLASRVVAAISPSASASTSISASASTTATPASEPESRGQAALIQIVQNTALASPDCTARDCQRLRDRLTPLTQQKHELLERIAQTEQTISRQQNLLQSVAVDRNLAVRILSQDLTYQAVWQRLQQVDQKWTATYKNAPSSSAVLESLSKDYQYHQQWLGQIATETLDRYLQTQSGEAEALEKSPVALNAMQDLIVATDQVQGQQLRRASIEQSIEQIQQQLEARVNDYNRQQAAGRTASATPRNDQYSGQNGERGDSAIARAQIMMADFPDGSLPKAILSIVVAAGAIATATAIAKQQANTLQSHDFAHDFETYLPMQNAAKPTVSPISPNQNAGHSERIASSNAPQRTPKRTLAQLENDWISELWDITGRSISEHAANEHSADINQPDALPEEHRLLETSASKATVSTAADETLTLELMANELAEWVEQVTTNDVFHSNSGTASGSSDPTPLRLPIEEVDRFAEQALLWILNEVNPPAEIDTEAETMTADTDEAWQAA